MFCLDGADGPGSHIYPHAEIKAAVCFGQYSRYPYLRSLNKGETGSVVRVNWPKQMFISLQ